MLTFKLNACYVITSSKVKNILLGKLSRMFFQKHPGFGVEGNPDLQKKCLDGIPSLSFS